MESSRTKIMGNACFSLQCTFQKLQDFFFKFFEPVLSQHCLVITGYFTTLLAQPFTNSRRARLEEPTPLKIPSRIIVVKFHDVFSKCFSDLRNATSLHCPDRISHSTKPALGQYLLFLKRGIRECALKSLSGLPLWNN